MQRLDVLNGNMAAALGAALAKPDVIAAYPITPQTPVVEYLTQFAADKKIDAAMSEVESELSAMSVVTGASLAGSRTFTATASQGLSLMYEPYFRASTLRLPIVMAIVNREMISPQSVWGGQQDSMSVRDGFRSMRKTIRRSWIWWCRLSRSRKISGYCSRSISATMDSTCLI